MRRPPVSERTTRRSRPTRLSSPKSCRLGSYSGHDAAFSDFLGDVSNDDHDVDFGPHGDLTDGCFCEGFWRRQRNGVWNRRFAFGADALTGLRMVCSPFLAGYPIGSAGKKPWAWPSD